MEKFLSFIFISILVLYLGGILGRWLLRRWILKKQQEFARRFEQQAGGAFGQGPWSAGGPRNSTRTQQREGEIKVQRTARQEKKASKQVGDYVDYEEVDECRTDEN